MDTTKKYIKQCEKVEEIQKEWQPSILDIFHYTNGLSYVTTEDFYKCVTNKGIYFKRQKTWLPYQDQLQKIVQVLSPVAGIHELNWWINDNWTYAMSCHSMEQLWLFFVMEKKYKKTWDGKDWIK